MSGPGITPMLPTYSKGFGLASVARRLDVLRFRARVQGVARMPIRKTSLGLLQVIESRPGPKRAEDLRKSGCSSKHFHEEPKPAGLGWKGQTGGPR